LLSENPNAVPILEKNLEKINWHNLALNLNAESLFFNLDYEKMRTIFQPIAKEIIEHVFHPKRLCRFAKMFNINVDEYLELF
jgi:hypothetical protein